VPSRSALVTSVLTAVAPIMVASGMLNVSGDKAVAAATHTRDVAMVTRLAILGAAWAFYTGRRSSLVSISVRMARRIAPQTGNTHSANQPKS
jgi:hypothetical protein